MPKAENFMQARTGWLCKFQPEFSESLIEGTIVATNLNSYRIVDKAGKYYSVQKSEPTFIAKPSFAQLLHLDSATHFIEEYVKSRPTTERVKMQDVVQYLTTKGLSQAEAQSAVFDYFTSKSVNKYRLWLCPEEDGEDFTSWDELSRHLRDEHNYTAGQLQAERKIQDFPADHPYYTDPNYKVPYDRTKKSTITKDNNVQDIWARLGTRGRIAVLDAMGYDGDMEIASYQNYNDLPNEVRNFLRQAGLDEQFLKQEGLLKAQESNKSVNFTKADKSVNKKLEPLECPYCHVDVGSNNIYAHVKREHPEKNSDFLSKYPHSYEADKSANKSNATHKINVTKFTEYYCERCQNILYSKDFADDQSWEYKCPSCGNHGFTPLKSNELDKAGGDYARRKLGELKPLSAEGQKQIDEGTKRIADDDKVLSKKPAPNPNEEVEKSEEQEIAELVSRYARSIGGYDDDDIEYIINMIVQEGYSKDKVKPIVYNTLKSAFTSSDTGAYNPTSKPVKREDKKKAYADPWNNNKDVSPAQLLDSYWKRFPTSSVSDMAKFARSVGIGDAVVSEYIRQHNLGKINPSRDNVETTERKYLVERSVTDTLREVGTYAANQAIGASVLHPKKYPKKPQTQKPTAKTKWTIIGTADQIADIQERMESNKASMLEPVWTSREARNRIVIKSEEAEIEALLLKYSQSFRQPTKDDLPEIISWVVEHGYSKSKVTAIANRMLQEDSMEKSIIKAEPTQIMKRTPRIGDRFKIISDNDNYDKFRSQVWTIDHIARDRNAHQGYDEGMGGQALVSASGLPVSLYEYEIELV